MNTNITLLLTEVKDKTGLSQTALASLIGTSQPTINRILGGQQNCEISTYEAIKRMHRKLCGRSHASTKTKQHG